MKDWLGYRCARPSEDDPPAGALVLLPDTNVPARLDLQERSSILKHVAQIKMIERIEDMPAGTIGLRASGKLSREDYRDVLEPALSEGVGSGELRMVFVLPDFDGLEPGAWIEDVKTGLSAWVRDRGAWKRFALVTDVEWVAKAMRLFTWATPGEVMVCGVDELSRAKSWVAG